MTDRFGNSAEEQGTRPDSKETVSQNLLNGVGSTHEGEATVDHGISGVKRGGFTLGQLSLWRDIADLPRARWHEANLVRQVELRRSVKPAEIEAAVAALTERHEGLRTTFDFDAEQQHVAPSVDVRVTDLSDFDTEELTGFEALPFDLSREVGWRLGYARTDQAVRFVIIIHHLLADGYAADMLQHDLVSLLDGDGLSSGPSTAPLSLVALESSEGGARRSAAAIANWGRALDRLTVQGGWPEGSSGPLCHVTLATGLSRELLEKSRPANVSVMALILAAYVHEISRGKVEPSSETLLGGDSLFVRIMISNRFSAERRHSLTSMNEWVAAIVPQVHAAATSHGWDEAVSAVSAAIQASFRHGIYSVDHLTDVLRARSLTTGDMDSVPSYNFMDVPNYEPLGSDLASGQVRIDEVGITVGPRNYLRATVGSSLHLTLRVPSSDVWRTWAQQTLVHMNESLRVIAGT